MWIAWRMATCISLFAAVAGAQTPSAAVGAVGAPTPSPVASRVTPRVTVSAVLGGFGGGAAGDLERGMRDAGYTTPFGGCGFFGCSPETPSPSSDSFENPWLVTVAYRHARRPLGVQLLVGGGAAGNTVGRSSEAVVSVDHAGMFVSPQAWVGSRHVRLGVGPAFAWNRWDMAARDGPAREDQTTRSLGVVGGVAAIIPVWRMLAFELTAQARLFRDARLERTGGSGIRVGLPATASLSHWYIGAGPAIRFE